MLREREATLSVAETFTGGTIATRLAPGVDGESVFRRGVVARDLAQLCDGVGLEPDTEDGGTSPAAAAAVATALRATSGASHALAVLITVDPGADGIELGGTISIGIADGGLPVSRQARLFGGRDWIRLGATEMALDCLRRHLLGLPVDEQIDFERR
jgi:nicotinamide-nucleotide amidase